MSSGGLRGAKTPPRIAVVVHLYYLDQWPEITGYLGNLGTPFALFVTASDAAGAEASVLADFPAAKIIPVPNVGRDIAPFFSLYPALAEFDLVCKLHTKADDQGRSLWRRECFESLLGNPLLVKRILDVFIGRPEVVLAGSSLIYCDRRLRSERTRAAIAAIEPAEPARYGFFAGTMFWIRPAAFAELAALSQRTAFAPHHEFDGQPEHAIERLIGAHVSRRGERIALTNGLWPGIRVIDPRTHKGHGSRWYFWLVFRRDPLGYAGYALRWIRRRITAPLTGNEKAARRRP